MLIFFIHLFVFLIHFQNREAILIFLMFFYPFWTSINFDFFKSILQILNKNTGLSNSEDVRVECFCVSVTAPSSFMVDDGQILHGTGVSDRIRSWWIV